MAQAQQLLDNEFLSDKVVRDRGATVTVASGATERASFKFDRDAWIVARGYHSTDPDVFITEEIDNVRLAPSDENTHARLRYGYLASEGARHALTPQFIPAGSTLYLNVYNPTAGSLTVKIALAVLERLKR